MKNSIGNATRENLSIFDTELKFRLMPLGCFIPEARPGDGCCRHSGVLWVIVEVIESIGCKLISLIESLVTSFILSDLLVLDDKQKKYFDKNLRILLDAPADLSCSISIRDNGMTP